MRNILNIVVVIALVMWLCKHGLLGELTALYRI